MWSEDADSCTGDRRVCAAALRYNWKIFSPFVDLTYAIFTHGSSSKWLVVRSNHIAYYADVDQTVPREVMLLDHFLKVRRAAADTRALPPGARLERTQCRYTETC